MRAGPRSGDCLAGSLLPARRGIRGGDRCEDGSDSVMAMAVQCNIRTRRHVDTFRPGGRCQTRDEDRVKLHERRRSSGTPHQGMQRIPRRRIKPRHRGIGAPPCPLARAAAGGETSVHGQRRPASRYRSGPSTANFTTWTVQECAQSREPWRATQLERELQADPQRAVPARRGLETPRNR